MSIIFPLKMIQQTFIQELVSIDVVEESSESSKCEHSGEAEYQSVLGHEVVAVKDDAEK